MMRYTKGNPTSFSENLLSVMHKFYANQQFCDVIIENNRRTFPVHKLILAAHSNYFKMMLLSDPYCGSIFISDDISKDNIEALILYLYTGSVTIRDVLEARELLQAATTIEVLSLVVLLEDYLADHEKDGCEDCDKDVFSANKLEVKLEPLDSSSSSKDDTDVVSINIENNDNISTQSNLKRRSLRQSTRNYKKPKPSPSKDSKSNKDSSKNNKQTHRAKKYTTTTTASTIGNEPSTDKINKNPKNQKSSLIWFGRGDRFFCKICYDGFKYNVGLYRHVKSKHPAFFRTSNCNIFRHKLRRAKLDHFKYSLVDRERMGLDDADLNFLCKLCKKLFPKKSLCIYHIQSHLNEDSTIHKFTRMKFIKNEKPSKIPSKMTDPKNNPGLDNDDLEDSSSTSYDCSECPDMKLLTEYEMTVHMRSIHPEVLHKCIHCAFQTRIDRVLKSHLRNKHRSSKLCTLCGKSCSRTAALNLHMLLIHKVKKFGSERDYYQCSEPNCDYVCIYKKRIEEHQLKHKQAKNYSCDICSKKFKHQKGLTKHKKIIHDNIRPFICDVCGQAFGQESDLKMHILRHDTHKPHACNMCSYASQYKANLQSHLFKIHQVMMNKKMLVFSCEECSYITDRRCRYNDHIKKKHQKILDIPCTECNKMFATKQNLYGHITAVHRPKSLLCNYCSYSTSRHHTLKKHVKIMHTHRDVKNYECVLCGFRSATSGNCRKHIRRLHMNFEVAPKFVGGQGGGGGGDSEGVGEGVDNVQQTAIG